jgi:hypothetical protein
MKITVDDWHFRERAGDTVLVDLFLDNGQHALLEVNAMRNHEVVNGTIPEMIVFCEMPGEKLSADPCTARWIARPPERHCAWSNVQVTQALMQQLDQRLVSGPPAAAAAG